MPMVAILTVMGAALAGLVSGWVFQIATLQLQIFAGVAIGLFIPCCAWLGQIQRLEKPLIAQSEETIKQVQYERHLRRHT